MAADTALIEKREELKRRLESGGYRTLIDVLLDGISRIIQKISRRPRPISPWYSSLILFVVILLTSAAVSLLRGDTLTFMERLAAFPTGALPLGILAGYTAVASMVVSNIYVHHVFSTFHNSVLDTAESIATLNEFEHWVLAVCNRKAHLIVSIVGGVLAGTYLISATTGATDYFNSSVTAVATILLSVCSSAFVYLVLYMVVFSAQAGRFSLKLYAADPSSSEVIGRLAGLFGSFVYLIAIYAAFLTLGSAFFGIFVQFGAVVVPFLWIPIIAMFVLNQNSLASIIRRAKWKTLNEIQVRVEQLQEADNLAEKDVMEAVGRLMDYHDRIKGTHNSAFDLRAVLSLLNSLLLPLLALLLANIDKILGLFR